MYGAEGGMGHGGGGSGQRPFEEFDPFDVFQQFFGGMRKCKELRYSVECTLEELYRGCSKSIKVVRTVGHSTRSEICSVRIEAGSPDGLLIKFTGKGNSSPGFQPGDLIFQVVELPHERFQRQKADLVCSVKISIQDALLGIFMEIDHLDGETRIPVNVPHVIRPNFRKILSGFGMPRPNSFRGFGNLLVNFEIMFPERIPASQKPEIEDFFRELEFSNSVGFFGYLVEKFFSFWGVVFPYVRFLLLMLMVLAFSRR
eukprot:TRINITY_DN8047_c0_g1_i1.p1 TRINITY_DN8047_c0_g1~~TRINITY_DN8047_c0_g1_i1.p1  ORF type:complete len:293 (-),score=65.08 TRINITY_DN8047_c0_g1_i1:185-955(-)